MCLQEIAELESRRRALVQWCHDAAQGNSTSSTPPPASSRSDSPAPSTLPLRTEASSSRKGSVSSRANEEQVEVQAGGHVYVNGKYLSDSAVEQRLRRLRNQEIRYL
ncbi:unnamed protein product [Symbiodinium pilosum]|uniref:Uncharacterized protein n=1 Tax=Symbiodinium pilosum TaxID=2952 RepID=A0A812KZM7_SYMPI|nr:unnamed protein product [Symbiodinium pilosum]